MIQPKKDTPPSPKRPTNSSEALRQSVLAEQNRRGISTSQLAEEVGYARPTISMYLSNRYDRDVSTLESKLRTWLANGLEEQRSLAHSFLLPPELRSVVRQLMRRHSISDEVLARSVSVSEAEIRAWLDGQNDDSALGLKLEAWSKVVDGDDFIETKTAEKIQHMIAYAHMAGEFLVVYGLPGVGKTMAVRRYHDTYPERCWWSTMNPSTSGLVSCLQEVAASMGMPYAHGGARAIHHDIVNYIKERPSGIMIVDEAQHLNTAAVEQLRAIRDATGVGLALVGNEQGYARLTGARRAAFAQIYSRIGAVLSIGLPSEKDILDICKAMGVTDKGARKRLLKEGQKPGGLRSVVTPVRMVVRSGQPVTEETLRRAIRNLGGTQ